MSTYLQDFNPPTSAVAKAVRALLGPAPIPGGEMVTTSEAPISGLMEAADTFPDKIRHVVPEMAKKLFPGWRADNAKYLQDLGDSGYGHIGDNAFRWLRDHILSGGHRK